MESKIEMKLEHETKDIKKICEKLVDAVSHELEKGIENANTAELGEAIDMIKDLYEAKEKMVKACYYEQIMEAMDEYDFEDEEEIMDTGRRYYRGQPRDSRGRYTSRRMRRGYTEPMSSEKYPSEWYRDMDREHGVMYYTDDSAGTAVDRQQRSESRSENARRGYEETKSLQDNSPEGKKKQMESLERYMKELSEDITAMVGKMDSSEKGMLKNKLQVLAQKVS